MSRLAFISVDDFDDKYANLISVSDRFAREAIAWLFHWRCVNCKRIGQEVNEIVPRSRDATATRKWKNRVLLCRLCHEEYHRHGVTDEKIEAMQEQRKGYLMMIGRGEYV